MDSGGDSLKSRYERNSAWADRVARLILLGLAIDIIAVFVLQKSWLESFLGVSANALIALGVWGELWFEKRAKEAGDGIVAEANARAAEANARAQEATLELARLRTPRVLSPDQLSQLIDAAKPFAVVPFDVFIQPEKEPLDLANHIAEALRTAGWNWLAVPSPIALNRPNKPSIGMTTFVGLAVQVHHSRIDEWREPALAIGNALHAAGIETLVQEITDDSVSVSPVHIRVGAKP